MDASESLKVVALGAADLLFPCFAEEEVAPTIFDARAAVKQAFFNLTGSNPLILDGLVREAAEYALACVEDMIGDPRFGRFLDRLDWEPLVEPGTADRRMRLQADFRYRDPDGRIWIAPRGRIVDGASVPRFLWRFADPFIGDYRRATVPHDIECEDRTAKSSDVHRMFYNAARCGRVRSWRAQLMYRGILLGGPDWKVEG